MIKRPFLWGIATFMAGILLAWYKIPLPYIIILALVGWLIVYVLMCLVKRYINSKDGLLWCLPILLILGFLAMGDRMKKPDLDFAFDEKAPCILTGEIAGVVKKSWGNSYYLKDNQVTLLDKGTYLVEEILLNTKDNNEYLVGNKITVSGTIQKFSINTNPGGFNEELYYKIQNIDYKLKAEEITIIDSTYSKFHNILNVIKAELAKVYETVLPDKEAGAIMAMVLGEKYLLDDEIKELYQENGISHILAISGLHISIVGAAIYFLLKRLKLGLLASTILSIGFVYSYGIFTNFSVSTNRAVVMYIVMVTAKLIGKTFDLLSALSLSAFLILIQNPMEIFNLGFILSFGAVLGIALILPCLDSLLPTKKSVVKSIYVSISAQVFTLPFLLYYFYQLPLYSIIINLIMLPLTSLLITISLAAGIGGLIYLPLGVFLSGGAKYILGFYELVCRIGSSLPRNLITIGRPDTFRIIIYLLMVLAFIYVARKYEKKKFLIILVIAMVILVSPKTREGLSITMLDVGQGEAIIIETQSGSNILIDGGSSSVNQVGIYRIKPYLLYKGIDRLDYAIVTHTDMDHVSGILEIIGDKDIAIEHLVLPEISEKDEVYQRLENLARENEIYLEYIVAGDEFLEGDFYMSVLHPPVGYKSASNNDNSTVLSIKYGEFDMLLTGDIESKGEQELISYLNRDNYINGKSDLVYKNVIKEKLSMQTEYDVLKVAHHGSKHSTTEEFLQIIQPEVSLISCGKNNRYGHPHIEVVNGLKEINSRIYGTYDAGAITITTDGEIYYIEKYLK